MPRHTHCVEDGLDVLRLDVSWLDYIVEIPIVFMSCDSCHCSPHVLIPGLRAPVSGIHLNSHFSSVSLLSVCFSRIAFTPCSLSHPSRSVTRSGLTTPLLSHIVLFSYLYIESTLGSTFTHTRTYFPSTRPQYASPFLTLPVALVLACRYFVCIKVALPVEKNTTF